VSARTPGAPRVGVEQPAHLAEVEELELLRALHGAS
jgi:hypothetical protein